MGSRSMVNLIEFFTYRKINNAAKVSGLGTLMRKTGTRIDRRSEGSLGRGNVGGKEGILAQWAAKMTL